MSTITVLLADDHAILRAGLRALLKRADGIQVVGEAENGRQAVALVNSLCPDVVVMDISMPLLNGFEATRQIRHCSPTTKVLVLSSHSEDNYVEQAMALGASGYLVKQTSALVLPEAIREVHQGHPIFSSSVARRQKENERLRRSRGELPGQKPAELSSREMEVLQLIAEGKANKETANELHISVKTVEKHRDHLMNKLNIHNTAGLTRYAIATGVIDNGMPA